MKCLAQGRNVIFHGQESDSSNDYPDSLTAQPPDPHLPVFRRDDEGHPRVPTHLFLLLRLHTCRHNMPTYSTWAERNTAEREKMQNSFQVFHLLPPSFITFDVELSKLQLLLVVPQQEVKVFPGDVLLIVEAYSLQHGLDDLLCLALAKGTA